MGATQKKEPQTVEREVITPERTESVVSVPGVQRMAGETWLNATKRATPVTETTTTPGSVTRVSETVEQKPQFDTDTIVKSLFFPGGMLRK